MPTPEIADSVTDAAAAAPFDYVVSGLKVRSSVPLPSAIQAEKPHDSPEVTIAFGPVAATLPAPERKGTNFAVQGDQFMLNMPGLMRVLISGGNSILTEPEPGHNPADLTLFLLGTCFAILLHQRGRVVLHASAVAVGNRAMLFCGVSGAGKSTLAAMLGQRGHPLLNDDVCNLSLEPDGSYVVYPDGRMHKLWAQSLEHLDWEEETGLRIRHDMEKFYMPPAKVDLTPRPVGAVYILRALPDGEEISMERLGVAEATSELIQNAYRPGLVKSMGMSGAYFQAAMAILRSAGVFRLSRPMDFAHSEKVLDLLETTWAADESAKTA